jgi:hypothetical protein
VGQRFFGRDGLNWTATNQARPRQRGWLLVTASNGVGRNAAAASRQHAILGALHLIKFIGEPHASGDEDQAISQSKRMNEPATAVIVVVLERQSRLARSDGPSAELRFGTLPTTCLAWPKQDHTAGLRRFSSPHAALLPSLRSRGARLSSRSSSNLLPLSNARVQSIRTQFVFAHRFLDQSLCHYSNDRRACSGADSLGMERRNRGF